MEGICFLLPTLLIQSYIGFLFTGMGNDMNIQDQHATDSILFKPATGTVLAVASGLSFFFLCMILPLVGPAGSKMDHAAKNQMAFIAVLAVTFLLAGLASYSKMGRRKVDGGGLPFWSLGLCLICVLSLIVLLMGGFSI
jgi:hypothetical protein